MDKNRLEAFSDGVMAIIITIMILDLKVPHNPTWQNYVDAYPIFLSYALSFVFVGVCWSSHHHLFHKAKKINNKILWLNMFGLFWLSLVPFATASMGENSFSSITVTVYASIMSISTISYIPLVNQLCRLHGKESEFSRTFKGHKRTYISIILNSGAGIISLLGFPKLAFVLLTIAAFMWFIPNYKYDAT